MTIGSPAIELEKLLDKGRKTAIISHFNPDGDAVGSSVGMRRFLLSKNMDADIVLPSRHPEFLDFLDPEKDIICYVDNKEKALQTVNAAELIICLDFNRPERTEWLSEALTGSSAVKVLIDHHLNPDRDKFDIIISDASA